MDLRETQLDNKLVKDKTENKSAAEYFGANLAHLLNLVQVTFSKDPPPTMGGPCTGHKAPATLGVTDGLQYGRTGTS